jgi:hypothetical protein
LIASYRIENRLRGCLESIKQVIFILGNREQGTGNREGLGNREQGTHRNNKIQSHSLVKGMVRVGSNNS